MIKFLLFITKLLPLKLRSTFYYRVLRKIKALENQDFESISLVFAKDVKIAGLKSDLISQHILCTGFYELNLSKLVQRIAQEGGNMLDIGANIGYFSTLFASQKATNKVYAFEPSPRNIAFLNKNVHKNSLKNIEVIPYAVANKNGTTYFEIGPAEQTGWGGIAGIQSSTTQEVKVMTLDSFLEDKNIIIDLLKIDIEGHDLEAIEGAIHSILTKKIKRIVFEYYSEKNVMDEEIIKQILSNPDFKISELENGNYLIECQ